MTWILYFCADNKLLYFFQPFFESKTMTQTVLTKQDLLELKARAHHLNPVVMIGQKGVTETVIRETDAALRADRKSVV